MTLHRDSHRLGVTGIVGVLLLLLAGCGGPNPVMTPTPTPTTPVSPLEIVSYDLHIPAELLNAPTIGPLPGTTRLHVGFTFKTNQQLLNQLGKLKVQQGQGQSLETVANQLGINDATYQQIKAFFGIENVTLSLNAVHTTLMVDGQAAVFARLFQTQFVLHQLNGRQVFAPASIIRRCHASWRMPLSPLPAWITLPSPLINVLSCRILFRQEGLVQAASLGPTVSLIRALSQSTPLVAYTVITISGRQVSMELV